MPASRRLPKWSLKELDPVYKPDHGVVEWAEVKEVPEIEQAVERLRNLGPLKPFDPGDGSYERRLQFWACILTGNDERRGYFFRAFSPAAQLARKPGIALMLRAS